MTRIEVPSETLLVELGEDGLNIVETFMQMSSIDESAQVQCDICSKPLGKMNDVKRIESPVVCLLDQNKRYVQRHVRHSNAFHFYIRRIR